MFRQALEEFKKTMQWSQLKPGDDAYELVMGNLNGFTAYLETRQARQEYKYGNAAGLEVKLLPGEPSVEVPEGVGNFVKLLHHKGKYSLLANWSRSTAWSPGKGFRIEFNNKSYPVAGVELMRQKDDILPAVWVAFKTDDDVDLKEGDVVRLTK